MTYLLELDRSTVQSTLAMLGWIPIRGLLDHKLYNVCTSELVYPGAQGTYTWVRPARHPDSEIGWDQMPDFYERLEREVLRTEEARQVARSFATYPV